MTHHSRLYRWIVLLKLHAMANTPGRNSFIISASNCIGHLFWCALRQEKIANKRYTQTSGSETSYADWGRGVEITSKISAVKGHLRADGSDGSAHVCGSINFNSPAVSKKKKNSLDCSRAASHLKPGLSVCPTADAVRREGQENKTLVLRQGAGVGNNRDVDQCVQMLTRHVRVQRTKHFLHTSCIRFKGPVCTI